MWKRHAISIVLVFLVAVSSWSVILPSKADAATETEIDEALADGIAYLVAQQASDGSWQTSRYVGTTGLAVAVLGHYAEHLGQDPLSPAYAYSSNFQAGLDYIFSPTSTAPVRHNGTDGRVWWGGTPETSGDNYVIGPAIMAIVMSGAPTRLVNVAGSAVYGMTYQQVVQEAMNYLNYTQCKTGNGIGSWYYTGISTTGDQSIAGWVTLGLGYAADRFGLTIPPDILDKLNTGIDIIQWTQPPVDSGCYGGAGYSSTTTPPYNNWINCYKVGHLLYMMGLVGDTTATPRVQRSLSFLERHWTDPSSGQDSSTGCPTPGWRGDPPSLLPSYIATAAIMKGLLKLDIEMVGPYDWFEDFSDVILANQSTDGSWTQGGYPPHYDPRLYTSWALLTLLKATSEPTPPTIATEAATEVTTDSATLNLSYTIGGYSLVQVGFYYKKSADTAWAYTPWVDKSASGNHAEAITGLDSATQYDFKAVLNYDSTVIEGDTLQFTTGIEPAPEPEPKLIPPPQRRVSPKLPPPDIHLRNINVSSDRVQAGQPVTVTANVVNNGVTAGSYNVALMINGKVEQQRTVEVSSGAAYPVKFTITRSQPGTYDVAIDNQRASFTVIGGDTSSAPVSGGFIVLIVMAVLVLAAVVVLVMTFRRPA